MSGVRNWIASRRFAATRCAMVMLGLHFWLGAWSGSPPGAFAQQGEPAMVRVEKVVAMNVASAVQLMGDVEPIRRSTVASRHAGLVVAFPHRDGEFVQKGEVLAQLETAVLELELEAAAGLLEARKQELAELENGTRAEVIDAARAKLDASEAMSRYQRLKHERMTRLNKQSAASQEEFDEAKALAESARAEVGRCRAELEELLKGPRAEQIARARALLKSQDAEVKRLQARLARYTITAPFAGSIVREHTQVGQWVEEGGPICDIIDLAEVDVRVLVPGRYTGKVRLGDEVRVDVESAAQRLLGGKVKFIVPEVDLRSRLFPVKVRLANINVAGLPILKAGMLASVNLPVGAPSKGVYVPKDALILGQGAPKVVVVRSEGAQQSAPQRGAGDPTTPKIAVLVPVRLEDFVGGRVRVVGNVRAGDYVVSEGNERLQPGQPIQALSSKASE